MSSSPPPSATPPPLPPEGAAGQALDRGPYEVIRGRLATQADELRQRMQRLNDARREVFGAIPTELLATGRITTAHNCTPRDITPVGNQFVLGYNVHLGLKSETGLTDVFAVHELRGLEFHEQPLDLLNAQAFVSDFRQVYKYYRGTQFLRFLAAPPYLYFLFQTGKSPSDVKAFKWILRDAGSDAFSRQGSDAGLRSLRSNSGSDPLLRREMVSNPIPAENQVVLEYIDNRSEHDLKLPPQHDFLWTRTHRDLHRGGRHPHISIEDVIFVEAVGGDLTIKVEDNTADGAGIYREPVDDPDQTLDDAEIFYALVGNIVLLKIRPFRETAWRYLAFNRRTQTVQRIDTIGQACVRLPEDHGLIFTNGYFLQTGEFRTYESQLTDLRFERRIPASNGEDHLYVFYSPSTGQFVLLAYNMIQQQAQPPLQCHGFSFFPDGRMVVFRSDSQPQKHHALQIWQTPFVAEGRNPTVKTDSPLCRIGNRDIVRGLAECQEIFTLCTKDDAWEGLYIELVRRTTNLLDAHQWLGEAAAMDTATTLRQIRETAQAAISEFEKVTRIRTRNRGQFDETKKAVDAAIRQAATTRCENVDQHVAVLAALRQSRGQLISLKELKYIDLAAVDQLEKAVIGQTEKQSLACIGFLAQPSALQPWHQQMAVHRSAIPGIATALDGRKLDEALVRESGELQLLIDIVSNLKIDDTLRRTQIIDDVSSIYTEINQARAELKNRVRDLQSVEGSAEFSSQLKLLGQAVINYLDICDTPQKCDELLTKMMVQVEEVEGRFAEFDEFIVQLAEKREEIRSAFDARKLQLSEARNRRAAALVTATERILTGIRGRVASLDSADAIHSFFAADLMAEKVRDLIGQLQTLGESVKVDDLQSRLKTAREEAVRQLLDRKELFVDGQNAIRFGPHQFTVNTSPLDLTTLVRDGQLCFHLTGTRFMEPLANPELDSLRDVWDQEAVSENRDVYRGEFLAWQVFREAMGADGGSRPGSDANSRSRRAGIRSELGSDPLPVPPGPLDVAALAAFSSEQLLEHVRHFAAPRYRESYTKGVHDHDAALILAGLVKFQLTSPLLRFDGSTRGLVLMFDQVTRQADHFIELDAAISRNVKGLREQIGSLAAASQLGLTNHGRNRLIGLVAEQFRSFQQAWRGRSMAPPAPAALGGEKGARGGLTKSEPEALAETADSTFNTNPRKSASASGSQELAVLSVGAGGEGPTAQLFHSVSPVAAAELFFESIAAGKAIVSEAALMLATEVCAAMGIASLPSAEIAGWPGRVETARDWVAAKVAGQNPVPADDLLDEVAAVMALGGSDPLPGPVAHASGSLLDAAPKVNRLAGQGRVEIGGLLGDHPQIAGGKYTLDFAGYFRRIEDFVRRVQPRFDQFHQLKSALIAARRDELKLGELQARVLTSFVRNRLVNDIYLPLIGTNLAKQIGTAGEQKRTDLMGMLLLISPPGYGKTTLMEYIASRLGITFVKINGPALSHRTTSLDPADAPNAAAREEINRLNLALEMGDNVMIYVDDIQHCDPEFLQKFISLCDATRKIEGVWRGKSRTYDLRGRKVCVVMAGNPYTESGEKFRIPDMLANRADTWNLGDVIGQNREAFELSYIENAVTSNPVLQRLASGSRDDLFTLIRLAAGDELSGTTLEGSFAADEISEITSVLKKLLRIRGVLLQVNRQYIDSAAQADAYRTEPPFRLQGSYRDMNKLAERVLPIMNDQEVEQVILDHYVNQAQTLTTGAEANLLRFRELLGLLSPEQVQRWDDIKRTFRRNLVLGQAGSDNAAAQVIAQIATLGEGLHDIRKAVDAGMRNWLGQAEKSAADPLRQLTLTSLGGAAAELTRCNTALDQIRIALAALSEAATLRAATPAPIEVKNSVPTIFLEIIRYQHETIAQWLDPLTKLSESLPAATPLVKAAKKVSRNYKKVIDQLEASGEPDPE